jgi:hypothetical protein
MKRVLFVASIALLSIAPRTASAQREDWAGLYEASPAPNDPPPRPVEQKRIGVDLERPTFFGGPIAGVLFGSFASVPVQRLSIGGEGGARWASTFSVLGSVRFEPGRTQNGLGAHRAEIGVTLAGGKWVRAGAGAHLAYAMIVRTTEEKDAFLNALFGDIGGFGLGVHACLGGELPLGRHRLELHVRGVAEVYNDAYAVQVGPVLGLRLAP